MYRIGGWHQLTPCNQNDFSPGRVAQSYDDSIPLFSIRLGIFTEPDAFKKKAGIGEVDHHDKIDPCAFT